MDFYQKCVDFNHSNKTLHLFTTSKSKKTFKRIISSFWEYHTYGIKLLLSTETSISIILSSCDHYKFRKVKTGLRLYTLLAYAEIFCQKTVLCVFYCRLRDVVK